MLVSKISLKGKYS